MPSPKRFNNAASSPARRRRSPARSPARSPGGRKKTLKRLQNRRAASPRAASPSPRRRVMSASPSPRRRIASPSPRRRVATKSPRSPTRKSSWGSGKKKIAYTPVETSSGKIEYVRCCRKRRGSGLGTLLGVGLGTGLGAGVGSRLGGTGGAIGGAVLGGLGGKLAADAFQGGNDEVGCVQC